MKKLLVLGVLPQEYGGSYISGVATVVRDLSPYFSSKYEVAIFATNVNEKKIQKPIEWQNINIFGYTYSSLAKLLLREVIQRPFSIYREMKEYKQVFGIQPFKTLLYRINLSKIIRTYNPQVIHAHGVHFAVIMKNIKENIPVITTYHEVPINNEEAKNMNAKKGININKLYKESATLIDNFTCLNTAKFNDVKSLLNAETEDKSYRIIRNGINLEKFKFDNTKRIDLRTKEEIDDSEIIFVTVASLTKRKGHEKFLEYISKFNINAKYWIIGEGPEYKSLQNLVVTLGLEERVKFFGLVPNNDLYKFYSAADCFILPSSSEGQAMVILEALACGLNIAVNMNIMNTLDFDEDLWKFIIYLDFDQMIYEPKIASLTHNDMNRTKISNIMKQYSWESIAKLYLEYFEDIE